MQHVAVGLCDAMELLASQVAEGDELMDAADLPGLADALGLSGGDEAGLLETRPLNDTECEFDWCAFWCWVYTL